MAPLGELSFKLHRELAERFNGREDWGYSKSTGISLSSGTDADGGGGSGEDWLRDGTSRAEGKSGTKGIDGGGPAWLKRSPGCSLDVITADESVAQV